MDILSKIETIRKALRLNHGEMAKELGLSRSMYYFVKSGERKIGNKAFLELERLEAIVQRKPETEARIAGAVAVANKYPDECSRQLAFEHELMKEHLKYTEEKLIEAEKQLKQLKAKLAKLSE